MHSFIVVYYGNTGSSWLIDAIGGGPDVLVPAFEPLEAWAWSVQDAEKLKWIRNAFAPPVERRGSSYTEWVAGLAASPQFREVLKTGFSHVGFKMTASAFRDRAAFLAVADEVGARLVFLRRENRIKHALSLYRYHEEDKSQFDHAGIRPPSQVKRRTFHKWVKASVSLDEELVELHGRAETLLGNDRVAGVRYEDFLTEEGKQSVIDRLVEFLGIDLVASARGGFEKATPDDLRAAVINYEYLRRRYQHTPLGIYFDD